MKKEGNLPKHFFDIRSKKKSPLIKESFVNPKKCSLIQRNRFVHIKEKLFKSTKTSSIQRNIFFHPISKKCFFDSKKLFSQCSNSQNANEDQIQTKKIS